MRRLARVLGHPRGMCSGALLIRMPQLSPAMREGRVSRWLLSEGEAIQPGELVRSADKLQLWMSWGRWWRSRRGLSWRSPQRIRK